MNPGIFAKSVVLSYEFLGCLFGQPLTTCYYSSLADTALLALTENTIISPIHNAIAAVLLVVHFVELSLALAYVTKYCDSINILRIAT